jgi:hypothetical protein
VPLVFVPSLSLTHHFIRVHAVAPLKAKVGKGTPAVSPATLKQALHGFELAYNSSKAKDGLANATALYSAAAALLPQVPVGRQQFYKSHILVQSAIQMNSVLSVGATLHPLATTITLSNQDVDDEDAPFRDARSFPSRTQQRTSLSKEQPVYMYLIFPMDDALSTCVLCVLHDGVGLLLAYITALLRCCCRIIAHLANATFALATTAGVTPATVATALASIKQALAAFDALFQAERDGEGDAEWRGVYWADRHRFTNFQARRREVLALNAVLLKSDYLPVTMIDCCQMEYAYQWTDAHLASYPLFYDEPAARVRDFVLISCANATSDGGRCNNGATTGVFWGSAEVTLSLIQVTGDPDTAASSSKPVIRYSLDGSDPAAAGGMTYTKPIQLAATTTLRTVKMSAVTGQAVEQSRNVTFTKAG